MLNKQKIIKEFLIQKGFTKEIELRQVLEAHSKTHQRIDELIAKEKLLQNIPSNDILREQLGWEVKKLPEDIPAEVLNLISPIVAYKHRIAPLSCEGGLLTIGTDVLLNVLVLNNFSQMLKTEVDAVLVETGELNNFLEKIYAPAILKKENKKEPAAEIGNEDEEAPIIKLINSFITEAYKARASDIHIEPLANKLRVRYRIDGILEEVASPPKRLQGTMISRVKLLAGMDLAEKRLPQDGRIRMKAGERDIDLRVSTLPAAYGESVVLRILDKSTLALWELGFSEADKHTFEQLIKLPNGIILVTGPTGSGKTTTLYAALSQINTPGKKLMTVEDPVEYQLAGINQMQVKPHIGLTFAASLRSMLRQSPDIIMVGEIRDLETATIAIQAAMTGHLIFSTLHTNDAPTAINRLVDMGVKPYLVAATLQAVLAQRLVRVICSSCRKEYPATGSELRVLDYDEDNREDVVLYRGTGCKRCNFTGYFGRISIFELLLINDDIRKLMYRNVHSAEIRNLALQCGMKTLKLDGRDKVLKGVTTVAEVLRVCQSDVS